MAVEGIMELEKHHLINTDDNWFRQASSMDNKTRGWKFDEQQNIYLVSNYPLKIFIHHRGENSHFVVVKLQTDRHHLKQVTKVVLSYQERYKAVHVPTNADDVPALPQLRTLSSDFLLGDSHHWKRTRMSPFWWELTPPTSLFNTATCSCFCHSTYLTLHFLFS